MVPDVNAQVLPTPCGLRKALSQNPKRKRKRTSIKSPYKDYGEDSYSFFGHTNKIKKEKKPDLPTSVDVARLRRLEKGS